MASDRATRWVDTDAPDRFVWLATGFGAVVVGGFVLVLWAVVGSHANDVAASPYHVPLYAGLAALLAFCGYRVVHARQWGVGRRRALPDGFGMLIGGAVTFAIAFVLDVGWREGVGLRFGIEDGFAPSRIMLAIALGMIAATPLRAALVIGPDRMPRLPVLLSGAFALVAVSWPGGFMPMASPWVAVDPDLVEPRADLWVMEDDGSRQTRLLEAPEGLNFGYASWAPDGSRIGLAAFELSGTGAASSATIWLVDPDDSTAAELAGTSEWRWLPRLTPDGAWVLYTEEAPGGPWMEEGPVGPGAAAGPQGPLAIPLPHADIWRVAVDGSGSPERLTDAAGDDRAPVPSPDGSLILFDSTRDGNTELYVMAADGSAPRRLTHDPGEDWGGSWSPDGSRIAFNSNRSGTMELYVMDADGSDVSQLTDDGGANTAPSWSPDGSRIAYDFRGGDQLGQVRSVAADGGDMRDLSRSIGSDDQLWTGGWGADGRIVFARTLAAPVPAAPLVRLDFGAAAMLLSAALVAAIAVLVALTAPPPGSFTLLFIVASVLLAVPAAEWRFIGAGVATGVVADLVNWRLQARYRTRGTGTAAAAAFVLGSVAVALATTGLAWTPTLALGVALAAGLVGWGLGSLAGMSFARPASAADTAVL